ncbi:helix-turn-helix transcriptional regulator [Nocardioides sp. NBC_00163]|uniref:AraC family transcriptional regulator n=1 Tax=Nocardioides sp. NBC_00163 TaxID=2975999 RepID=UPI00324396C4
MTATAATEIDALDFEVSGPGARWETAVRDDARSMTVQHRGRRGNASLLRSQDVGDLRLSDWDCPPLQSVLALGKDRDAERDVVVVLATGGGSVQERVRKVTLALPRAALVAAGCATNLPACHVVERGRPLADLLLMVLDGVWSRLPVMSASEIEATRGTLVTLAAGVIRAASGTVADRSGLPALRVQLDEWITGNLRGGPIHVEDLAAAHNVSTRTVHRAFSMTGDTMTAVVRARRLAAVREELVHTNSTIENIAHRWCFYDASHLSREFRRCFGVSPSAYRESHGC